MPADGMTAARDAAAFLTRMPVGRPGGETRERQARALTWFPLVGALVGGVIGGVRLLAEVGLPTDASTLLGLTAAVVLTGALHEDGLADTADGLGVSTGRARRLEVMRDARIGTFGALALVGWLGLAWSLLGDLDAEHALRAAVAGGALGRWSVVLQARFLSPARTDGLAAGLSASTTHLVCASLVAAAVTFAATGAGAGGAAILAAVLLAGTWGVQTRRSFGGATGDTYGAGVKLVEVGVYAVLVAGWTSG